MNDLQQKGLHIDDGVWAGNFDIPKTASVPGTQRNRVLKPAAKAAELESVTIQSLRRTTATHLSRRATVSDTRSQMRHSTSSVTFDYYARSVPASRSAAVEAFAAEVGGILNVF